MIQATVQDKRKVLSRAISPRRKNNEAEGIVRVLNLAAVDDDFIAQLTDHGSQALEGYHLSPEAKAALLSGDIRWIESRVGTLTEHLRTWIDCRLQQEIW